MWPEDQHIFFQSLAYVSKSFHFIWVPHENQGPFIDESIKQFSERKINVAVLSANGVFSFSKSCDAHSSKIHGIVVLKKGILAELYDLDELAYVGGGYGKGVHSVWEPALAYLEVACGPRTKRSPESQELSSQGLLLRLDGTEQDPLKLAQWINDRLFKDQSSSKHRVREVLAPLIAKHQGAAHRIVQLCEKELR
jgi:3-deoxy-D-manno-octulosonic-acid transferase